MSEPSIYPPLFPTGGSSGPLEPEGWDRVVLGGYVLPGKSKVIKGGVELRVDLKQAKGRNGARPTFHGVNPAPLEVQTTVWTDDQLQRLYSIASALVPDGKKDPKPVAIDAPHVRHLPLRNVVVTGVSQLMESTEIKGGMTVSFYLLHWMPTAATKKKSASSTPERSIRNARTDAANKRIPPNPAPSASATVVSPK